MFPCWAGTLLRHAFTITVPQEVVPLEWSVTALQLAVVFDREDCVREIIEGVQALGQQEAGRFKEPSLLLSLEVLPSLLYCVTSLGAHGLPSAPCLVCGCVHWVICFRRRCRCRCCAPSSQWCRRWCRRWCIVLR